jgi:hypothetical protein
LVTGTSAMPAPHCFCVHASAWPCTLPRICAAERGPHHCSSHHRCTGSWHGVQLRQVPRQLGRDGGPRTQESAPGAAGAPSGKRTAGRVQGFQLLQEQGRSRRRRSTCRGRDDGHGLALRHGLPLTESVLRAAAAARQTAGRFQSIPATRMRCKRTHAAAGTPTQHAACTCGV